MPSFFSAVTRFLPTPGRDPREESLTEIFAEVLRRVPRAAHGLARECGLSGLAGDEGVVVTTQRPAAGLERVDVEVRFGELTPSARRLWLELKWSADPSAEQHGRYESELRTYRNPEDRVVIIAPWALHAERLERLDRASWLTWTDVGLLFQSFRSDLEAGTIEAWLAEEFLDYLEENDLSAHQGLELEHLAVISAFGDARERFVALVDRLDQRLGKLDPRTWEHPSDPKKHAALEHYRMDQPAVTSPDAAALGVDWIGMEFSLAPAPPAYDVRTPWALGAGFKAGFRVDAPQELLTACRAGLAGEETNRFLLYEAQEKDEWFVMRHLPLSAVVDEAGLDAQVERLATFAEESWKALSARPAPR